MRNRKRTEGVVKNCFQLLNGSSTEENLKERSVNINNVHATLSTGLLQLMQELSVMTLHVRQADISAQQKPPIVQYPPREWLLNYMFFPL